MNLKQIKNCLTCEFGINNCLHDQDWNIILPDELKITCSGNDKFYGKEVCYKSSCEFWTVSLEEFSRVEQGINYQDFYKEYIELLDNQLSFSSISIY